MGRKRIVIVAVVAALALVLADAALTDNYQYKRTAQDDAKAGATVFKLGDFTPAFQRGLKGGRVKPDQTPSTSTDRCNGYLPKQSDLAITGDAESRFHDGAGLLTIDTQVRLFKTAAMAATDWNRQSPTNTAACIRQSMAKDRNPGESLVSITSPPPLRSRFQNATFVVEMTYNYVAKPRVHYILVVTELRSGRTEAVVVTSLRKLDATATTRARTIQVSVLAAVLVHLSAT